MSAKKPFERPLSITSMAAQHYGWGGTGFIPGLLGVANPEGRPFAELWLGTHPGGPTAVGLNGETETLGGVIASDPDGMLGPAVAARFGGQLPYLFKLLDARKMLSIQAHPTKRQAEEGFARENAAGVPAGAPNRNYKDDNHKPEVHVALTDFWMLHGFRPLEEIGEVLRTTPELAVLMPDFAERLVSAGGDPVRRKSVLRDLYAAVMEMPQDDVDAIVEPLLARLGAAGLPDKDTPEFWALRAADDFPLPGGHRDRGIISVFLLNLLHLKPGDGTYQPAGMLHAYLEGVNVELMANSDNVLRGGLTPKHVDVPELMVTLSFEDGRPDVLTGVPAGPGITVFPTPAPEFELARVALGPGETAERAAGHGPDTVISLEGEALLEAAGAAVALPRGRAAFVPDGVAYRLTASAGPAVVYRASTP